MSADLNGVGTPGTGFTIVGTAVEPVKPYREIAVGIISAGVSGLSLFVLRGGKKTLNQRKKDIKKGRRTSFIQWLGDKDLR